MKKPSWIGLVTLCTTASLAAALASAVFFGGIAVAFAVGASSISSADAAPVANDMAAEKQFSGLITDDHCRARHMDSQKTTAECVRMCVRNGSRYLLVDGDKQYFLEGNEEQIDKLAAQRVIVAGTLNGDSIRVSSLAVQ